MEISKQYAGEKEKSVVKGSREISKQYARVKEKSVVKGDIKAIRRGKKSPLSREISKQYAG